jgi:hypothetical protein
MDLSLNSLAAGSLLKRFEGGEWTRVAGTAFELTLQTLLWTGQPCNAKFQKVERLIGY